MESRKRTILKSLSWAIPFLLLLLLMRNGSEWVLGTCFLAGIVLYYFHDRGWSYSTYGREVDVNVNLKVGFRTKKIKPRIRAKNPARPRLLDKK